ncbi:ecdysone receptor [Apis cerana cerana]|uniref:Ecdysone receptor n=1 Tax=Apis cerana cerana TaxID=94128 RepID=A0A2A3E743_APICC|nr:ecdysone receptor [Apis cerana cerana]
MGHLIVQGTRDSESSEKSGADWSVGGRGGVEISAYVCVVAPKRKRESRKRKGYDEKLGRRKGPLCVQHGTVAEIFFPTEVTTKIETVESKEQQTVVLKVEQADEMLQTVPRVPVAGIKRRWGNRHTGSLQESSPEVSSSGVLSPPPNFQPSTPESAVVKNEELQLWDLDLHRGLQTNGDHYRATITATTTTTVLPTVTDPASPFTTTPIEAVVAVTMLKS